MFVAMGAGAYSVGMFHLFTHAFFKALLFLGSGSVIYAMHHEQDIRNMGGLVAQDSFHVLRHVHRHAGIDRISLLRRLFLQGCDHRIRLRLAQSDRVLWLLMTVIAAGLTAFYSWRLMFKTFFGEPHDPEHYEAAHESPLWMLIPIGILAAGSILAGFPFKELFAGHGVEEFFRDSLKMHPHIIEEMEAVPEWIKLLPTLMMAIGAYVSYVFYIRRPYFPDELANQHQMLYQFLLNKWYFDELYDLIFVRPTKRLGRFLWKVGDGYIIDGFGPDGVSARVLDVTRNVVRLQTGYLYHYAFRDADRGCRTDHLVHVRLGRPVMTTWPILSLVTSCQVFGALIVYISRGDDEAARRNSRWIALWTTLITFAVSLILVWRFDPTQPTFSLSRKRLGLPTPSPITWASTASRCRSSS
jgi:NADH-quinone oxidoreductase subunit L